MLWDFSQPVDKTTYWGEMFGNILIQFVAVFVEVLQTHIFLSQKHVTITFQK